MQQNQPVNRPASKRQKGNRAESLAVAALEKAGYVVIARNWRCAIGEIDIVARHRGEIVIVEVRSALAGIDAALESIGRRKANRLAQLAQAYLNAHGLQNTPFRVDVVAVSFIPERVEIIEHAVGW